VLQVGQEAESNFCLISIVCHKLLTESSGDLQKVWKALIVWGAMAKKRATPDAVREYLASIGKKGGLAKVKKGTATLTKAQRAARARKAAAARWGKKD